jgi:hypothetical protein
MCSKGLRVALLGSAACFGVALAGGIAQTGGEIRLQQGDLSLTVQNIRGALLPAAFAQSAAPVVLNGVTIAFGPISYRAPRIEVIGLKSSRPDLEKLFDPDAKEPLADRIAKLEAEEIRIPELVVSHDLAGVEQRGEMRNLVARGIVSGHVASVGVEAAFTETKGPQGRAVATQGRMVIEDLDGAWLARVLTEKSSSDQMARVYGRVSVENMVQTGDQGIVRVARLTGRDFVARRTSASLLGALSEMLEVAEAGKSSPTEATRILSVVGELGGAFDAREVEVSDIEAAGPDGRNDSFAMRVSRIGYRGAVDGAAAETRLENLSVETPGGRGAVAAIALTGFSFKPTFAGLRELSGQDLDNLGPEAFRKLLPTFGRIRVEGVSLASTDISGTGPDGDRGRFSIKSAELGAGEPVDGIPTSVRIAVDGLAAALPRESDTEGVKTLLDLGYRSLDVSFASAATWNPGSRELVLGDIAFNGAGMGSFTARGVLGNISSDAFSSDSAIAMVALMEATMRSLDVTLVNAGLFDRILEREARQRKKSFESVRREYGVAASMALPALLGSSEQAKALSGALARFLAKPGRLTVNVRAKDPQGLGIAELAGSSTPAAALDHLEIKAVAQEP